MKAKRNEVPGIGHNSRGIEKVNLTGPQANIYVWGWQPEARYRYAVCGRRFGKTFVARKEIRRAIRLAIENDISPDNEIWYGAPNFRQAKRVFWRALKRSIPRSWIDGRPNETECSITLNTGHVIRLVGLDDPDSLRGSGLWFFIGDEWDDAKDEAWPEVIRPMLSTCGGHALFIGTAKGYAKLYAGYNKGQPGPGKDPHTMSWKYTTVEGGNVPAAEVEEAKRTLDPRTYRQEYEASFETYSGRVIYGFAREHSVKPCPYDPTLPVHIGMDFNVNPMSATVWQEHGADIWQVDEIVIPTSNTTEMATEIVTRYGRASFNPTEPALDRITIYPDPSGASGHTSAHGKTDISILRKDFKLNVVALNSHPLVRDRNNWTNAKFLNAASERHAFVDPKCEKSIECYERLVYKDGTSEPDKKLTTQLNPGGVDHLPDSAGYYIYARFAKAKLRQFQDGHMGR
jgi:hypothetical protein